MREVNPPLFVVVLLMCGCSLALADDVRAPDKSEYNLFKPTPSDLLRPMTTQAYDNVKDPATVDAGHFQVEGAFIDYFTQEHNVDVFDRFTMKQVGSYRVSNSFYSWKPRFTVGLLNNLDLEVTPTYGIASSHLDGSILGTPFSQAVSSSGFGVVLVESKLNLWGNDGGKTSFAVSPILSIPTDRGHVVGGFEAAFAIRLPKRFYVKLESDVVEERDQTFGHYVGFIEGLSLDKSICSKVDAYAAMTAQVYSGSERRWSGYAGFGAIYKVARDFQLFGGLNVGLTDSSFDYNPRAGIAWRL